MTRSDPSPEILSPPHPAKNRSIVVACLGSSSTAGKGQAFDWIGELQRRSRNKHFRFQNLGVGGDLAYNALQRLPDVLACRPQKVVVWIGGNDVIASVSKESRKFLQISKRLPATPSAEWFHENLRTIARRLKTETDASIALCSLPPIGEDPTSTNPIQSELNLRTSEYSAIVKAISVEVNVSYLAAHEAVLAQIAASPGRAFTEFRFSPFFRDAWRALVLRKSPDQIAQMNGWRLHTDGVHLNSRGAMIVGDLIQGFIDQA